MNILMIEVPSLPGEGSVPFGLLYAASSAHRAGHSVRILDQVKEGSDFALVRAALKEHSPKAIGLGGITPSYKNCKRLIAELREENKDIPIIIGGVISSVHELLLTKAGADYVVHGEAELTFPELLKTLEDGGDVSGVKGISYLDGGNVRKTGPRSAVPKLDDIPMPEFSLLDMSKYLDPLDSWARNYFGFDEGELAGIRKKLSGKRYLFPIITARGCTHKCIFCYRHLRGWRQHSVGYVISMMRRLQEKYGADVFQINDELTTADKSWVKEFCAALKREKLGILFIVLSSRVDSVNEDILRRLKDAGCIMINYGYESGSDTILKEIRKGVSREQALRTGLLTKKVGIKNVPEIIVGFPSETDETVEDTIDFLKRLDTWPISTNTPMPFPETSLWSKAVDAGLIGDEEEFISSYRHGIFVNFTEYPDDKVKRLAVRVRYDTLLNWLKNRGRRKDYIKTAFERFLLLHVRPLVPGAVESALRRVYKSVFGSKFN